MRLLVYGGWIHVETIASGPTSGARGESGRSENLHPIRRFRPSSDDRHVSEGIPIQRQLDEMRQSRGGRGRRLGEQRVSHRLHGPYALRGRLHEVR